MIKRFFLLLTLIVLSLISGVPINGQWGMIYDWELTGFSLITKDGITLDTTMWLLTVISHIGILILPFILNKSFYLPLLFFMPLIFMMSLVVMNFFLFFALIRFVILWIIAVRFAIN